MEIKSRSLPNLGTLETELPKDIIESMWHVIEEAKIKPQNMKPLLAGNISSSLSLNKSSSHLKNFHSKVLPKFIQTYLDNFNGPPVKFLSSKEVKCEFVLDSLWVNFQKQHEFNPLHDHGGALSFVIWMKIPTSFEKQKQLSIVKNTKVTDLVSNFSFVYNDILGNPCTFVYYMEKTLEGNMVMFPSRLHHQVYPFYESDKERVSISGNIGIKSIEK